MPELSLSVLVTRAQLGLTDLEINDHLNYFVASEFLSGQVTWNRNVLTSAYIDGGVTVTRNLEMVNERVVVEVLGADQTELYDNISTLLVAFKQDHFRIHITAAGEVTEYQCEAADYQVNWDGPRWIAHQVQCIFSVPRQPVPRSGGF